MFRQVSIAATQAARASRGPPSRCSPHQSARLRPASHHTVHLTAKRATELQYKSGGFTEADSLKSTSGKALGTDVSDCTPVSSTKADCTGALGLDGGLLVARFSLNFGTGSIQGTINGGTMAYSHAAGTITGTSFNGGSHLTVTYH